MRTAASNLSTGLVGMLGHGQNPHAGVIIRIVCVLSLTKREKGVPWEGIYIGINWCLRMHARSPATTVRRNTDTNTKLSLTTSLSSPPLCLPPHPTHPHHTTHPSTPPHCPPPAQFLGVLSRSRKSWDLHDGRRLVMAKKTHVKLRFRYVCPVRFTSRGEVLCDFCVLSGSEGFLS